MSNLGARLLTAAVLVPILMVGILWENPLGVFVIVWIATLLGLREFYGMVMPTAPASEWTAAVIGGMALSAGAYFLGRDALLGVLAGVTITNFLFFLFRYRVVETMAARFTASLGGALYVGLLLAFVALLKRRGPDGGAWVFVALTVTWFGDTGAYFAGRFIGPSWPVKLYPAVSPKKTVVGGLGGLGGSLLATVLARLWYLPTLTWLDCVLVAIPAGMLGQTGDLCESLLKRSVGVKDSGRLLPGHGGMLDRIDALLFSAPYIYLYARFVYRG